MGGSNVQKTTVDQPSSAEQNLMNQVTAMLPMFMSEAGYDVSSKPTRYEDDPKAKDLLSRKNNIQKQIANLKPLEGPQTQQAKGQWGEQKNKLDEQLKSVAEEEAKYRETWTPTNTYDVRKLDSPAVEAARAKLVSKYGDLSDEDMRKAIDKDQREYARKVASVRVQTRGNKKVSDEKVAAIPKPDGMVIFDEYTKAKETSQGTQIEQDSQKNELMNTFMEKTKKYLDGDFSISEEQKNLIKENNAPIRAAVEQLFNDAIAQADKTSEDQKKVVGESDKAMRAEVSTTTNNLLDSVKKTFDEFESRVKETGMSLNQALDVVGAQVQQTGLDMEGALKNTVAANKELLKLGIEDYTGKVTKQVAMNAARMGRSPDDPEYTNEIATNVAKQVKEGTLNLAAMEAQGMIGIKERTGAGLESVANARVGVAERTGGQLEQSSLQRGGMNTNVLDRQGSANEAIAARTAQAQEAIQASLSGSREELLRARGTARIGMEEGEANQRWQVGAGMPPSQLGVAQGALQYNQALSQQRIANAQAGMNAPAGIASYFQNNRLAQPTTTQTYNPGWGDYVSAGIGAAGATAQIIGAV